MNWIFSLMLLCSLAGCSQHQQETVYAGIAGGHTHVAFDHSQWDALLKKYVTESGKVNYKGFMKDRSRLDKYLKSLSANVVDDQAPDNEQLAFWINAYNAFTIDLILNHYPLKSIKDIGGPVKTPWDIAFAKLGDKTYTLNHIEHQILRKKFDEPRIHFAIVCASFSCPRLLNQAYTAANLEANLDKQATYFINNPDKNVITVSAVKLSKLFDWFKDDFTNDGNLAAFINKYAKTQIKDGEKINYLDYNWSLNE